MTKKQIYSWNLNDWVRKQLPKEVLQAMHDTGWNVFGIYELVKEGLLLERRGKLSSKSSGREDALQRGKRQRFSSMPGNS